MPGLTAGSVEQTTRLDAVFAPRSIAVIGASRDPRTMSGQLFQNLRTQFRGVVYPVNPRAREIDGIPCVPSLLAVPGPVDLVFIAVPASAALGAVQQCIDKQVRGIVMITAGFAETGETGRRLERQLETLLRESGIPLIGPNCFGVINTDPAVQLHGTFGTTSPVRGHVAVGSQSGALGVVIPDYLGSRDLGVSMFASVGNKLVVSENELLEYWRDDPATQVILLYLESFRDPRHFRRIAPDVLARKPIVALKSGRSAIGARAAGSHTAALVGSDRAAAALFRQTGVLRVETLEELFDVASLLAHQPLPRGRSVAILTNAGGPAILCADVLAARGLMLPEFTLELQSELRLHLPREAAVGNPVDLIGSMDPRRFQRCLELLLDSPEIDAVIVIYVPLEMTAAADIARAIRETAATHQRQKTLLTVAMQQRGIPLELADSQQHIPGFQYPEAAAAALAGVVDFAERRRRPAGRIPEFPDIDAALCREAVQPVLTTGDPDGTWLDPGLVHTLLSAVGLRLPRARLVTFREAARQTAQDWDVPVVVKIVAPGVLHKSDVGGVLTNIRGAAAVSTAFEQVTRAVPNGTGVLIQEFIGEGTETLIGGTWDPQFGHVIVFGAGGTAVEILNDVACRLHPLSDTDVAEMIEEVRVSRLLHGFRGQPPGDIDALGDALLRVSSLLTIVPEICELDLNPIKVLPDHQGTFVLDARIRIRRLPSLCEPQGPAGAKRPV